MTTATVPTVSAIANWFGSNRTLAEQVGKQLGECRWVGVPFAGGCCELPYIRTKAGVANDLHRHVINLARVIADGRLCIDLIERLGGTIFHVDELKGAQARCNARELARPMRCVGGDADLDWAYDYFLCSWMGRGGQCGMFSEFYQPMSVRWDVNGGDSAKRFRSAADSVHQWFECLKHWSFVAGDGFEFLSKCKDEPGYGIYVDPPWVEKNGTYKHDFEEHDHRSLAGVLALFKQARVVIRYGDHPLIEDLYPESIAWTWIRQKSRSKSNAAVDEVLIINGPAIG